MGLYQISSVLLVWGRLLSETYISLFSCGTINSIMIRPAIESDEKILFENEITVLTNERLIAKSFKKGSAGGWTETNIKDLFSPKRENGGKKGKFYLGSRMASAGLVMILMQMGPYYLLDINIVRFFGRFVENLFFAVSMLFLTIGGYFALGSYLNPRPHTSVWFVCPSDGDDVILIFDGWDNEEAEELSKQFRRAKRML